MIITLFGQSGYSLHTKQFSETFGQSSYSLHTKQFHSLAIIIFIVWYVGSLVCDLVREFPEISHVVKYQ